MKAFRAALIALIITVLYTAGQASLITDVKFKGLEKSTSSISLPGHINSVRAGLLVYEQVTGDLNYENGEQFVAFCIELDEQISSSSTPYRYSVVDTALASNSSPMGQARAHLLNAWFGQYYQGSTVGDWTTLQASAFQLGVWEIVYEDLASIGTLDSGGFWMDSSASGSSAIVAMDQTNTWFANFDPQGITLNTIAMSSPYGDSSSQHIQDAVTVNVPEPSTIVVLGIGSTLLFIQRRRSKA